MIHIAFPTEIARPVEEVFAYVTDPAKLPDWQPTTVSVTQETPGPGGVFRLLEPLLRRALERQFKDYYGRLMAKLEEPGGPAR